MTYFMREELRGSVSPEMLLIFKAIYVLHIIISSII